MLRCLGGLLTQVPGNNRNFYYFLGIRNGVYNAIVWWVVGRPLLRCLGLSLGCCNAVAKTFVKVAMLGRVFWEVARAFLRCLW